MTHQDLFDCTYKRLQEENDDYDECSLLVHSLEAVCSKAGYNVTGKELIDRYYDHLVGVLDLLNLNWICQGFIKSFESDNQVWPPYTCRDVVEGILKCIYTPTTLSFVDADKEDFMARMLIADYERTIYIIDAFMTISGAYERVVQGFGERIGILQKGLGKRNRIRKQLKQNDYTPEEMLNGVMGPGIDASLKDVLMIEFQLTNRIKSDE